MAFNFKFPPIIACTAFVSEEDKELAFKAGMSDYVTKPVLNGALDPLFFRWLISSLPTISTNAVSLMMMKSGFKINWIFFFFRFKNNFNN